VVYDADELGRAWFGRGGVGYVIAGEAPVTGSAPVAETRRAAHAR